MKRYHVVHNKYVHILMNNKQMTHETNVTVIKFVIYILQVLLLSKNLRNPFDGTRHILDERTTSCIQAMSNND